jgi:hypothetical protein
MARPRGVKVLLLTSVLGALFGIIGFVLVRESTMTPAATTRTIPPALAPPRPALSPAEEAYALALWPIHTEVKASALRMIASGLSYKLGRLDRTRLRTRIEAARATYRRAATRIGALTPPPSMAGHHRDYLEAVRLYERSASEMVLVADDGRDEHLVRAHPFSTEAGVILLKVGNDLWPTEYKPN